MELLKNFLNSEKGVFAYLLPMIGITVLVVMGKITVDQYVEYMLYFAGIYTGGKAIQGAGAAAGGKKVAEEAKAEIQVLQAALVNNDQEALEKLRSKFETP